MCRMLAKLSLAEESLAYAFLDAPHSLFQQSQQACQLNDPTSCGPHANGCGVAYLKDGQIECERRGAKDNWNESYQIFLRGISTRLAIGHNRKASLGLNVDRDCSHPYLRSFNGVPLAFCHNGDIESLLQQAKTRGISDSEIFFEQILEGLPNLDPVAVAERVQQLALKQYDFSSLNALMLSPTAIYAWRFYNSACNRIEDYERYYTLYRQSSRKQLLLASEPIDSSDSWISLKNGTFLAISCDGATFHTREIALL